MYLSHYAFKLQHSKAQHYTAVVAKANLLKNVLYATVSGEMCNILVSATGCDAFIKVV